MVTERASRTSPLIRVVLIVIAVVLLALLLLMGLMMPMMGMMGGGMWADGSMMSPVWGVGMMLLFLLVFLGIGYLIYRTVIRETLSNHDPALEELRLAYARGDLSQEEFEQRREDLQQSK